MSDMHNSVKVCESIIPTGYLLTTRTLSLKYIDDTDGCREALHCHKDHALFFPQRASASLTVDGQHWTLALNQGLWVPAGTVHSVQRTPHTTLAVTYMNPRNCPIVINGVEPVVVNVALRELLQYLADTAIPREQRLRAQIVCMELVTREAVPRIELPLPRDVRISHIARSIMRDPADNRSIDQWAYATSQSSRTIARAFRSETGLTFSQWRTRARLAMAIRLLEDGIPIGVVARRVGYTSNSAFTAAFQRLLRKSPREFLAQ